MVHAVSATFERFEHMSPPAAGLAALLHVVVAALLLWAPVHKLTDEPETPIEVTMEQPPPPAPKPEPKPEPKPAPSQAAKPPPAPPPTMRGLAPAAPLGEKTTGAGKPADEAPEARPPEKVEEPATQKSEAPQQALAPPPPPAPPALEKELPPVEMPSAPVTSRDIPRPAPPAPEAKPQPQPKPPQHTPQPPAPQASIAPSPLSRLPPRGAPPPSTRQNPGPPPSPFVNPADVRAQNDAADYYLQQVNYKISLQVFAPSSTDELNLVVGVRFTIARDGRLLDISIARSSGNPSHDDRIMAAFRAASPFPPLPEQIPGTSRTFILPIGTRRVR